TSFVGPLILWLIKKDEDKFVDSQGKEALNFQITVILASISRRHTFFRLHRFSRGNRGRDRRFCFLHPGMRSRKQRAGLPISHLFAFD
ncbi:MAG: DUF4870 domain-containing protein, partial [Planctomycetales bacterium]|nr:DUF4870 domain-containing protein [Planctomycetales bacterium]